MGDASGNLGEQKCKSRYLSRRASFYLLFQSIDLPFQYYQINRLEEQIEKCSHLKERQRLQDDKAQLRNKEALLRGKEVLLREQLLQSRGHSYHSSLTAIS